MAKWQIDTLTRPGTAALPGEDPSQVYQRLIAQDRVPAPSAVQASYPKPNSQKGVSKARYLDLSFHRLEVDRMWTRTWQMACREEEIAEVGDYVVYDLAEHSYIVTRSGPDEIRAYRNACLHRGTRLCDGASSVRQFRCPFHGFTWSLNGSLKEVPCRWDFPQIENEKMRLPEARVGRWGGFVFINMNPQAEALDDYLGVLTRNVSSASFEHKYIAHYFRKVLPANWKACIEAFLEAYHSVETHAWSVGFTNDANAQYDVFPDTPHVTRFMHAFGVQSPHIAETLSEQDVLEELFKIFWSGQPAPKLSEGVKARAFAADLVRRQRTEIMGRDYSHFSDAEALDSIEYSVFPNLVLFDGLGVPVVYRFRPNGDDPNSCIYDLYMLLEYPEGSERPAPAEVFEMGDMSYQELTDLKGFDKFFGVTYDQDTGNLGRQQKGMKTLLQDELLLSQYQESRLRHLHELVSRYVGDE